MSVAGHLTVSDSWGVHSSIVTVRYCTVTGLSLLNSSNWHIVIELSPQKGPNSKLKVHLQMCLLSSSQEFFITSFTLFCVPFVDVTILSYATGGLYIDKFLLLEYFRASSVVCKN